MSLPKKKTAREEGLEAAWHLFLEQGEKPSTAKVRQIVQRGSDSHLNEGVNAFWDELKAKAQQWHAFPKDADFLMPLVSKLLDDVLHKAQSAYEDQLRDTKQLEVDAKRWIETVDKEKAALEEQLAAAQHQLQTLRQQNESLQESCDARLHSTQQLQHELAIVSSENSQLKARVSDLKDEREKVDVKFAALEQVHADVRDRFAVQQQETATTLALLQEAKLQIDTLGKQRQQAEQERQQTLAVANQKQKEAEQLREKLVRLDTEKNMLEQQNERLIKEFSNIENSKVSKTNP